MIDAPSPPFRESVDRTFLAIDLVGYTALTDIHGDEAAASLAIRLADATRSSLAAGDELVKELGDGVLIASHRSRSALLLLERILAALRVGGLPLAARAGAHHGPAIPVGPDYYGGSVNLATRLAQLAKPGRIVVTESVVAAAREVHLGVAALGSFDLRHLSAPIEVFEVTLGSSVTLVPIDPVCHMRLDEVTPTAFLAYHGRTVAFCSRDCADRFVADPSRFIVHLDDC